MREWFGSHWALVGYLVLLTVVLVVVQTYQMRTTHQIQANNRATCARVNTLAMNEEVLRVWLIQLAQRAWADESLSKETRLVFKVSVPMLAASLVRLGNVSCEDVR